MTPGVRRALSMAAAIVALDQITKWWALRELADGNTIDLVWTLRFNLVFNEGSAFSVGSGFTQVIAVLAIVISVVLIRMARRIERLGPALVLGAVLGGAVGNLVDRVFRADGGILDGAVVDFIDLQWWPVFNVADMAIVIGCALLLVVFGTTDARPDEP